LDSLADVIHKNKRNAAGNRKEVALPWYSLLYRTLVLI